MNVKEGYVGEVLILLRLFYCVILRWYKWLWIFHMRLIKNFNVWLSNINEDVFEIGNVETAGGV